MSTTEIANYISFGLASYKLFDICNNDLPYLINRDIELTSSDFAALEDRIRDLYIYPEIADLPEYNNALSNATYAKFIFWPFAKFAKRVVVRSIHRDMGPIIEDARRLLVLNKPRPNLELKDRIIPIIRRFEDIKNSIPKIPEGLSVYRYDADKILMGEHGALYADIKGVLAELKTIYPVVQAEHCYQQAYKLLDPRPKSRHDDEHDLNLQKVQNLPSAMANVAELVSMLKTEYGITDEEVRRIPELEAARAEVERLKAVGAMLLEKLEGTEREPLIEQFDIRPLEDSLFKLTTHATRATEKVDGKRIVTTSESEMKLIFNNLLLQLENTQFPILYGHTQNILDHMHEIVRDPDDLIKTIEEYTALAQIEIQRYRTRAERLARMAGLIRAD